MIPIYFLIGVMIAIVPLLTVFACSSPSSPGVNLGKESSWAKRRASRKLRKMGQDGWELKQHNYLNWPHLSGSFELSKGDTVVEYICVMFDHRAAIKVGGRCFAFTGGHDTLRYIQDLYKETTGYKFQWNPLWDKDILDDFELRMGMRLQPPNERSEDGK